MQIIRIFRWEKKRCIQKGLFFIHFRRSYPQYQLYPWERITRLLTMLQVFWSFIVFSFYYLSSILFCFHRHVCNIFTGTHGTHWKLHSIFSVVESITSMQTNRWETSLQYQTFTCKQWIKELKKPKRGYPFFNSLDSFWQVLNVPFIALIRISYVTSNRFPQYFLC